MSRSKKWYVLLSVVVMLAMLLGGCKKKGVENKLEIFSWWTTGGEAAGLNKMYDLYKAQYPDVAIENATVAGGAGSNAKAVLASRMQGNDPPDSFQVHMGHELIDTYVVSGKMENLDDIYKSEGFDKIFPKGVLDIVSYQGHYYSVPVNIHRANVMWYNTKTFATLGITAAPTTAQEWFVMAEKCKAAGLPALALGDSGPWTAVHLFETVLIGSLGADGYKGLWTGTTAWTDPKVTLALQAMKQMLAYVNSDHAALSWDQANQLVIDGKACTTIMGDWVDADNLAKKFADSGWAPAPGNAGIYDALSDSFGLPKGAKDPEAAKAWLKLIGSKAGQEAFNPLKGSVCARTDCNASLFGPYLQSAIKDWQKDAVVPSLAHGAAASPDWVTSITNAINVFTTNQDVAATQSALAQACKDAGVCK